MLWFRPTLGMMGYLPGHVDSNKTSVTADAVLWDTVEMLFLTMKEPEEFLSLSHCPIWNAYLSHFTHTAIYLSHFISLLPFRNRFPGHHS